jgi:signal transduction histidine kinase
MTSQDRGAVVAAWWPWLLLPGATTALITSGLALAYAGGVTITGDAESWVNPPLAVGFSVVAAGIWATRPEGSGIRRLGVLYTVIGVAAACVLPAYAWAHAERPGGESLAGAELAGWISDWVWAFGAAPLIGLGVLLYPDGLLPGRRWRLFGVLGLLAPFILAISAAADSLDHSALWDSTGGIGFVMLLVTGAAGLVGLVVRYRRAVPGSDERGQIGGFAAAATLIVVVASLPDLNGTTGAVLALAVGTALPVAVGRAVLRHRLLDPSPELAALSSRVQSLTESRRDLVTDREEERTRLRRELHDGLGPSLAAIGLGLRQLQGTAGPQQGVVRELGDEVQRAVAEVRRICEGLRPGELAELGLVAAIQAASMRLAVLGGPAVTVAGDPLPPLPAAVEVAAFRLTMEAMTNAIRHSRADHVAVRIDHDHGLTVTVTDDGIGLRDPSAGVGLRAMHERAEELGGWARLDDAPEGGLRVRAWFPTDVSDQLPTRVTT